MVKKRILSFPGFTPKIGWILTLLNSVQPVLPVLTSPVSSAGALPVNNLKPGFDMTGGKYISFSQKSKDEFFRNLLKSKLQVELATEEKMATGRERWNLSKTR